MTTLDLWILVLAALIVGAGVTACALPPWWADRKRHQEPIEPIDLDGPRVLAALERRGHERNAR